MEINIKTKFNVGDTVYTVKEGELKIISFTIQSVSICSCENNVRRRSMKNPSEREDDITMRTSICYSENGEIYRRKPNGNETIDDEILFYLEDSCFLTKQELIAYLLSQQ